VKKNFGKTSWFGFGFISLKLKKPNQTQTGKKPNQTGKNQAKPVLVLKKPNRTEPKPVGLTRFWFFLKKITKLNFFFKKTKPNKK
jgi:hypothetical protein